MSELKLRPSGYHTDSKAAKKRKIQHREQRGHKAHREEKKGPRELRGLFHFEEA